MARILFHLFVIILSVLCESCAGVFKQEKAKIVYVNPKYFKNVSIFTYRESRSSPYLTSMNATNLLPITNNVTVRFQLINPKLQAFPIQFEFKACDGLKTTWIKDWVQTYADIPLQCPVQIGDYHFIRFELPPKNIPLKFNNIDYNVIASFLSTETEEKMLETTIQLRFNKHR